jgi:hypothetical protein
MRHKKMAGLCLVAMFALAAASAASATSASAEGLPALYECGPAATTTVTYYTGKAPKLTKHEVKAPTGKYTESKCKTAAGASKYKDGEKYQDVEGAPETEGKYEIKEGLGKKATFSGTGKGANLQINGVGGVTCKGSKDTGKFNSTKTANEVKVTFTGCELNKQKCSNTATAGEVKTSTLKGEVGYLEGEGGPEPVMGILLSPETSAYDAIFKCGPELYLATLGSVIGEVDAAAVNHFTNTVTLTFLREGFKQHWLSFEGGLEEHALVTKISGSPKEGETPEEMFNGGGSANLESAEGTIATNKGETLELKA